MSKIKKDNLEKIVDILGVFKEATDTLEQNKAPSSDKVVPIYVDLLSNLKPINNNNDNQKKDSNMIVKLKTNLTNGMKDKYFHHIVANHHIST